MDVSGSSTASGSDVNFALYASGAIGVDYFAATSGTIQAVFFCPDATTCTVIQAQMFTIQLPDIAGVLRGDAAAAGGNNAAIFWDSLVWTQYSTAAVISTPNDQINLTFYNQDSTAASYRISFFDPTGKLLGTQATATVPAGSLLATSINAKTFPQLSPFKGLVKVLVDGGGKYFSAQLRQQSTIAQTGSFGGVSFWSNLTLGLDFVPAAPTAKSRFQRRIVEPLSIFPALNQ